MVVTVVSAMPSVAHTDMARVVMVDEVVATTVIPTMSSYAVPCMCATIGCIEHWAAIVEVVTMWVAGIDAEVPVTVSPIEWTIEIGGCTESA